MKAIGSLIFVTMLLTTLHDGQDAASKQDLEKLQGTWRTISLVSNGKILVNPKETPKDAPETLLVYQGDNWLIKVRNKTLATGKFKLDATKTPKEIDIMDESGMKNDKTKLGIYELEGDTYKFCLAPSGKARPTEFTAKEGSGHSLGISKREKP